MAKSRARLRVQLTSARGDDVAHRLARLEAEQVRDAEPVDEPGDPVDQSAPEGRRQDPSD